MTHLMRAVGAGDLSDVRKQIERGIDPNQRNKDRETPLLRAVYRTDSYDLVKTLLAAGADPNLTDSDGNTPLMVGAHDENLDVVRELVNHKANVNARNREGDTPLTNAACWGSASVVDLLLHHGADPALPDGAGVSAANLARQHGHTDIAKRLSRNRQAG